MNIICLFLISLLTVVGPSANPPGPEDGPQPEETVPATVTVEVEGVTARIQSAPIAALREIAGRLEGESFSVIDGKYVVIGDRISSPPLNTEARRVIGVEQLETGLFKARLEVRTTPELAALTDKLRERAIWGEGALTPGGPPILARKLAREDAIEKAILEAVKEVHPSGAAPMYTVGKFFFLGTVREKIEDDLYKLMARVKVWLASP